jgi:Glycosyltransferase family 87
VTVGILPIRRALLRPARDGAILACVGIAVIHVLGLTRMGVDAHAYWHANPLAPYGATAPAAFDAYRYAPAFTQALWPFHALPWEWFAAFWTLVLTATLVWQAGLWTAPALLLVPVFADLTVGNIHLLLGLAVLVGFRWPWAWSFVLLTKITPGVGLLWFAVRREWRSLGIALGATAAIAAVSFVIAPALWWQWTDVVRATSEGAQPGWTIPVPLPVRLVIAVAVVTWGARTNRRWTVPLASTIALPLIYINGLAMLVAIIPLLPRELGETPASRWLASRTLRARAVEARPLLSQP